MNSAMGMVAAMVKVPQGLPLSALTTTSATTASRMTMISRTVTRAMKPPTLPISSRAIWPSDLPSRRIEANRIDEILHGAAQHRADDDPERAGQVAELRGQHRPDQRTGTGDGGEMVAEDDPLVGGLEIVAVAQPLGGRGALVVERHHAGGDELRVEAVTRWRRCRRRPAPARCC